MPEENTTNAKEIQIIDEDSIRDKIHVIHGVKVMLDYDLARIYGYATKDFNRQVRNNSARFEGDDFMFQLSSEELDIILRCKKATSSWGGSRYRPNAFTEQGIYMLMTVLRGELAVKQSRALIRAFQTMKNNIIENRSMIGQHEYLQLSLQVNENKTETSQIKRELTTLGAQMTLVMDRLSNVV